MSSTSSENELSLYQELLTTHGSTNQEELQAAVALEEVKTAPLIWWDVKHTLDQHSHPDPALQQYAVLGQDLSNPDSDRPKPILLNTNTPWSAFLCGSQGSGKSHALSCMLENCLLQDPRIGKNPNPLAGLVFHYDSSQGSGVCEAAHLCSEIPVTVLVSASNHGRLKEQYENMARMYPKPTIEVKKLELHSSQLDTERVKTLMAVEKDGEMPLYMQVLIKILREMATDTGGLGAFDYAEFEKKIDDENFTSGQSGPMEMRLDLLRSFLGLPAKPRKNTSGSGGGTGANPDNQSTEVRKRKWQKLVAKEDPKKRDLLKGKPGNLTIIDLTDPVIDADSACVLFDICLSIFLPLTTCGKIVALDEAHNYMKTDSAAAKQFTGRLLKTVREQRHQGARIVVATQEPSINTALLDLCSITMVHQCTSPEWFKVLKKHIAALYLTGVEAERRSETAGSGDREWFQKIVQLKQGESLLFCPTAAMGIEGEKVRKMVDEIVTFRTRKRLTGDGGRSKNANDISGHMAGLGITDEQDG
ncbi:hypothetical protein BU26DRAFT_602812 [Trematosphaeria pertusa]|uniref:P-loop containing nucleoside triphosphate hydrolase protein n=1 Tax=Trematosphaeria pertusa TaxID=390896 RepID=A0A6A6IQ80_9PLEO|nr:uncharacterized protein BU26DRAFT_602812 [Trematosphaeria pertusa]KAF2252427.1 hypothetical protein BU26DRAFT_602812 [Trematosphaeria pertusa]